MQQTREERNAVLRPVFRDRIVEGASPEQIILELVARGSASNVPQSNDILRDHAMDALREEGFEFPIEESKPTRHAVKRQFADLFARLEFGSPEKNMALKACGEMMLKGVLDPFMNERDMIDLMWLFKTAMVDLDIPIPASMYRLIWLANPKEEWHNGNLDDAFYKRFNGFRAGDPTV